MFDGDPFDNGTPKYHSATDIYDALHQMESGEEIGILSDMFSDVSWEGQDYYYTDNGSKLVERWENMTDYGDKMWLMDVAVWQLSKEDANDWVYQILCNDDLAKRIGFKKLFVENVLGGTTSQYKAATEALEEELQDLDRFDFYANSKALNTALFGDDGHHEKVDGTEAGLERNSCTNGPVFLLTGCPSNTVGSGCQGRNERLRRP